MGAGPEATALTVIAIMPTRLHCFIAVLNPAQLSVSTIDLTKNDSCGVHGEAGGQEARLA
jgi:hypothetical protein